MTTSTWIKDSLGNRNFLQPNGFKLSLLNFPKVSFYCQSANLPGVSVTEITVPTPFRNYPVAGTETDYEDLIVKFLVDEDLENYITIHNWLKRTGLAETFDTSENPEEGQGVLEILNSNFRQNIRVEYDDLFPVSLTTLDFDSTSQNLDYVVATAVFKYKIYRIKDRDGGVIG